MKENLPHNTKEHKINRREFIKRTVIFSSIGAALGTILAIIEKNYLEDINTIQKRLDDLNNPQLKNEILELNYIIKNNLENHKKIYEKINKEIKRIEKNIDKIKINDESEYLNYLEDINKKLSGLLSMYENLDKEIETQLKEINSIKINNKKTEEANLIISNYLLKQKLKIQKIKLLNLNLQLQISDIMQIILQRKENYIGKRLV
jgi:hypothetical protein